MNIKRMATTVGADWNDIVARLSARLSEAEIEAVGSLPALVNGRLTRSLGRVFVNRSSRMPTKLELSRQLLGRGTPQEITDVFLHEVAHVAADIFKVREQSLETAHGPIWARFARCLGVAASATAQTSYGTEARAERRASSLKVVAICDRCLFKLEKTRRLNRRRTYSHRQCGGKFVPR